MFMGNLANAKQDEYFESLNDDEESASIVT